MQRNGRSWPMLFGLVVTILGCGESGVDVDPAVEPFVGTWDATVYEIWPESNPSFVVDVLTEFGPFHLRVEPSGQYTATLEDPRAQPEIGQLTVIGSTIRLDPTTPAGAPPATATFSFPAADALFLDGPIEADFNDDQVDEPGGSHIELQRR